MPSYKIYRCDVLSNACGGFDINDYYFMGYTLHVDRFENDEKTILIDALKSYGLIFPPVNNRYLDVENCGDDFIVSRAKDGRQLYQFNLKGEENV